MHKETVNCVLYYLSAEDSARLNMTPSLLFRNDYEAQIWLKDNKCIDAEWRGYCVSIEVN